MTAVRGRPATAGVHRSFAESRTWECRATRCSFRRFVSNSHLLVGLGSQVGDCWVTADSTGRTSVAGVWVAGNAVDPRAQVITAAGAGSAAAIALNADLVDDDLRHAVRDVNQGVLSSLTTDAN